MYPRNEWSGFKQADPGQQLGNQFCGTNDIMSSYSEADLQALEKDLAEKMVRKIGLGQGTLGPWCHCELAGSHTSPLGSDTVPFVC